MKRSIIFFIVGFVAVMSTNRAWAEDPFAGGADALAVADSDGSASLRAKKQLTKMGPDMVIVQVASIDDSDFPNCIFMGKVIKEASSKEKHFKLIGAGKVYRFAPVFKMKGKTIDFKDEMTQNNLGACYYPQKTKLVVKVGGVDLKKKVFKADEIYLK